MFGKFTFLIYMLIFTLVPILLIWLKFFNFLKKNVRVVIIVTLLTITLQFIADPFAESWNSWFFNRDFLFGIWIINFPIENTLFAVLISVAISSTVLAMISMVK